MKRLLLFQFLCIFNIYTVFSQDLTISGVTLSSTSVSAGNYIYPSITVKNIGSSTAGQSYVGVYLSLDSILTVSDTQLGYGTVNSIAAGSSLVVTPSLSALPSTLTVGKYYLFFYADYSGIVSEANESNNEKRTTITVSEPFVDLSISSITATSTNVKAGTYFYPTVYEYNSGNSTASTNYIGYYLSTDSTYSVGDTYLTSDYIYSLSGGTSSYDLPYLFIPTATLSGTYYIIAIADYSNSITETNEKNNTRSIKITVSPSTIDLRISSISATSTNVSAGSYFYPTVYEYNGGNSTATGYNYIGYYLSTDSTYSIGDTYLTSDYIYSLSAGASTYDNPSLYIPTATLSGTYYIIAIADYSKYITETNEDNNSRAIKITVAPATIDLRISSISATSTNVFTGSYFYPTVYEYNAGNTTATGYNYIGYYLSTDSTYSIGDTYLTSDYIYSLSAGASTYDMPSLFIPTATLSGTYYIIAIADYSKYITETNEDNNTRAIKITVIPSTIDLRISSITATSTNVTAGNYFYPTVYESNSGNSTASTNYIGYYLSTDSTYSVGDTYLTSDYIYSLSSGASTYDNPSLFIPTATLSGTYYIIAMADYSKYITETNENNNTRAIKITVAPATIDLRISSITATSTNVSVGSYFYPTVYEYNAGNTTATGYNYIGYYLSTDSTYSIGDTYLTSDYVYSLSAGSSTYDKPSLFIPTGTLSGTYYIIAIADYSKYITETNEDNNTRALKITVAPASIDLKISSIITTSTNVTAGSYLYPTVYEYNAGNTTATGYNYIGYYLSTDSTYSVGDTYLTSDYVYSLSGGSSTYDNPSLYIPTSTSNGTYYIIAIADYSNYITESNENNNTRSFKITVAPASIDLRISSITSTSTNATPGSYLYPTVYEYNAGNTTATGYNYIGYYLSTDSTYSVGDTYLTSDYVYSLSGGSSTYDNPSLYIPTSTSNGTYYIIAIADYSNYITESNENNNTRSFKITVGASNIDIKIYSLNSFSNSVTAGTYFYPTATVYNTGNTYANSNYIAYFLSTDSTFDKSDTFLIYDYISSIGAGSYVNDYPSLYIPTTFTKGQYYIIAYADYYSYISESNENNNTKAFKISLDNPLGVEGESIVTSQKIYPNPSNGSITVAQLKSEDQIEVYDMNNVKVYHSELLNAGTSTIDLQTLPKGVYFLKIKNQSNYSHTEKLIITK